MVHKQKTNEDKSWCKIKLMKTGMIGWIPAVIVAEENSLQTKDYYAFSMTRIEAQQELRNASNGNFLIRYNAKMKFNV